MKQLLSYFILLLFLNQITYAQFLPDGIYSLSNPLSDNLEKKYLKIHKQNFIYFSLGSSVDVIDGADELKEIGTGKYILANFRIRLNFTLDSFLILPYVFDSVIASFSSIPSQTNVSICVEFNNMLSKYKSASLIVQSATNEYTFELLSSIPKTIHLPSGIIIKSLRIAAINVPLKNIPFDVNFNNLKYVYFARDKQSGLKIINSGVFYFQLRNAVNKNKPSLKGKWTLKILDKGEMSFLKITAVEKDTRLAKILNFEF